MAQMRRDLRRAVRGLKNGNMFCKHCKNMNFLVHLGSVDPTAPYHDPFELARERTALKANGWRYLRVGPRGSGWYSLKKGKTVCPNAHLLLSDNNVDHRAFQLQAEIKVKNVLVEWKGLTFHSGQIPIRQKAKIMSRYKGCKTYSVQLDHNKTWIQKGESWIPYIYKNRLYSAQHIEPNICEFDSYDRSAGIYAQKKYERFVDWKAMKKLCEDVQSSSSQPVTIYDAIRGNNLPLLKYFVQVRGVSPNYTAFGGGRFRTPLYVAAHAGHLVQVEYLLQMGGTDTNGSVFLAASSNIRQLMKKEYQITKEGEPFNEALHRKIKAIDHGLLNEAMVSRGLAITFLSEFRYSRSFIFNLRYFLPCVMALIRHPARLRRLWMLVLSFMHSNWFVVQGCVGTLPQFEHDPWIPCRLQCHVDLVQASKKAC